MKNKKKIFTIGLFLIIIALSYFFLHSHNYKEIKRIDPSCTEEGQIEFRCWCGSQLFENIEIIEHNYKEKIIKEPTCTENGEREYTCISCKDSYREEISAIGHNFYIETSEASCNLEGQEVTLCKNCDYREEKILPLLEHNYVLKEESKHKKVYECDICEDSYTEELTNKSQSVPEQPQVNSDVANPNLTPEEMIKIAESLGFTFGDVTGEVRQSHVDPNAAENSGVDISGVTLH